MERDKVNFSQSPLDILSFTRDMMDVRLTGLQEEFLKDVDVLHKNFALVGPSPTDPVLDALRSMREPFAFPHVGAGVFENMSLITHNCTATEVEHKSALTAEKLREVRDQIQECYQKPMLEQFFKIHCADLPIMYEQVWTRRPRSKRRRIQEKWRKKYARMERRDICIVLNDSIFMHPEMKRSLEKAMKNVGGPYVGRYMPRV